MPTDSQKRPPSGGSCGKKAEALSPSPLSEALKALGHPVRLEIIRQLAARDRCCAGDFCGCLPLAQSTISQHLDLLVAAGIVERNFEGTKSILTLNSKRLEALAGDISSLNECCSIRTKDNT